VLYIDDGETHQYTNKNGKALIHLSYDSHVLSSAFEAGDENYLLPATKRVNKVLIMG